MRKLYLLCGICAVVLATGCNKKQPVLESQRDTLSWAMGMSLASTVQSEFYDFDPALVQRAFESSLSKEKQPLDTETYNAACQYIAFLVTKHERETAKRQANEASAKQAEYFDQLLKTNPKLKKAPEGFYYEVLSEGQGPTAKVGLRVRFDFTGINPYTGQVIETTQGRTEPLIHLLARPMFEGLLAGMQLMRAGSKYRFYFPHELVTGANGIPPYTPVVYEVELHEIYPD